YANSLPVIPTLVRLFAQNEQRTGHLSKPRIGALSQDRTVRAPARRGAVRVRSETAEEGPPRSLNSSKRTSDGESKDGAPLARVVAENEADGDVYNRKLDAQLGAERRTEVLAESVGGP